MRGRVLPVFRLRFLPHFLLGVLLVAVPRVFGQALPDLGDVSQATITPLQERRLGENIMREVRADRTYYDEPEVTDYLNQLGQRLAARSLEVRQEFEFFFILDPQINAFALPGGFIGVNTGLVLAAQSESEVAGVMAHEISHVSQRHIARMLSQQKQALVTTIASIAAALLLSRVSSDAAQAAFVFGQAGVAQSQLNFTRDHEREADRVGLQLLGDAGFDPRGMATFFERLQKATRVVESAAPSYLRTHPLPFERIADIQNRIQDLPYRQVPDSIEFQLIRAKLKADTEPPREAMAFFEASLAERKFLSEAASHYGLAVSSLRANNLARARSELAAVVKLAPPNAVVETLSCRIARASGGIQQAEACYREAIKAYPRYRALVYDYADALLQARQPGAALQLIESRQQVLSADHKLYQLQARTYAALNRPLAQHRALAEAYARQGNFGAAVEQLQIGLKSGDGDFYQLSGAEARLRELRRLDEEARKEAKR
ncbi:MAG TPA: M48 family metalloprotease [Burkholderiales bacterium]|jgi:predicted Zn-dependent protease|nr:M48 family metalloprotease [Burkholderiales bacterium]